MSRSAGASNTSSMSQAEAAGARALLAFLLVGLVTAMILPWLVGPGAGLTFNGYDLAEWASLYPAARAETPPLLTPLLLRLALALAGLVAVASLANPWLRALAAAVTALALMPPLDFLASSSADPNYRQQFALAAGVLLASAGIFILARRLSARRVIVASLGALGLVVVLAGLLRARDLLALSGIQVALGPGGLLMAALFLAFAVSAVRVKQTRQSRTTASSQGL